MAEEQGEAVDERDLDQEKGKTEKQEIERHAEGARVAGPGSAAWQCSERRQDEGECGNDGLQQRQNDDEISLIDEHEAALSPQCHELGQKSPLEGPEEKRAIVRRWLDVEPVSIEELRPSGTKQRHGCVMERRLGDTVVAVRLFRADARIPGKIELPLAGETAQGSDLSCNEGAVLHQEHCRVPAVQQHQSLGRSGLTFRLQRCYGGCEQLHAVAWRTAEPAGDGEHTARRKMVEIGLECLDRVDRALTHCLQAGGGCGEGIEERQLDEIQRASLASTKLRASAMCKVTSERS